MNNFLHLAAQLLKNLGQCSLAGAGLLLISHSLPAETWVTVQNFNIPPDAIVGGNDLYGINYVCRGGQDIGIGTQLGSYSPFASNGCEIGFGGSERVAGNFQVLTPTWRPGNGQFDGAIVVGDAFEGRFYRYVCRANIQGSLQPGKIGPGFDGCYIPFGGQEIHAHQYELLVGPGSFTYATVEMSNGQTPPDAIRGGTDGDGTPLYLCVASFAGGIHPGKLRTDFGGCDISYGGGEYVITPYRVAIPSWSPGNWHYSLINSGQDVDGTPLYVCRAKVHFVNDLKIPGKTRDDWKTCHFALNGREQESADFEGFSFAAQ